MYTMAPGNHYDMWFSGSILDYHTHYIYMYIGYSSLNKASKLKLNQSSNELKASIYFKVGAFKSESPQGYLSAIKSELNYTNLT